ncbi:MAG: glycosyltransferase family 2 protein [Bacteroidota bacterium]|nr:glycosyltransferase family 2 protein [Bacteroidota bacterium]
MRLAIVIPCYNVSRHIEKVVAGIPSDILWIIMVDDASTDDTNQKIKHLSLQEKRIIYIRHDKNKGVGGAVITGYQKSLELDADITIKIDGDGQMDPAYINSLLKPIIDGKADFTKGNRFRDLQALRQMPMIRRIGNLGLSFLIKAASGYWNIFDPTNGYTAISSEILKNINFKKIHARYFFESSMLIEIYHIRAVVLDIPMKALYGDEVSGLSVTRTLFEFPPKLAAAFIKRILLKYFLFEFNIASVYILFGVPLFLFGAIYGGVNFVKYASSHIEAPTGTVVIPTLLITLGFQLLLSAANYDIENYPKK